MSGPTWQDWLALLRAELQQLQDVLAIDRNRNTTLELAGHIYTARLRHWLETPRSGEAPAPGSASELPHDVAVALGIAWDVDGEQRRAIAEAHNLRELYAELLPMLEAPDPDQEKPREL
jgi:hypothetical protein